MKSEKDKMLSGELYDAFDPELVEARERARDLCHDLNRTREREQATRRRILTELLGRGGDSVWMQPPFYCDYGSNIHLGERVYFNYNCVVLDVCRFSIVLWVEHCFYRFCIVLYGENGILDFSRLFRMLLISI